MADITNFDDKLFYASIDKFEKAAKDVISAIADNYSNFMTSTSEVWASPNAIVFKDWVNLKQNELENEFLKTCNAIMMNAAREMTAVAAANGKRKTNYISSHGRMKYYPVHQIGTWSESKDGLVGMNMGVLTDNILPTYEANLERIISKVDDIPKKIALYDDEKSIRHYYSVSVSQLGDRVKEHLILLKDKINSYITNETDNIMLAVKETQKVIDSMKS